MSLHEYDDKCECDNCNSIRTDVCMEIFLHEGLVREVGVDKDGNVQYQMTEKGHHLATELPHIQELYAQKQTNKIVAGLDDISSKEKTKV